MGLKAEQRHSACACVLGVPVMMSVVAGRLPAPSSTLRSLSVVACAMQEVCSDPAGLQPVEQPRRC